MSLTPCKAPACRPRLVKREACGLWHQEEAPSAACLQGPSRRTHGGAATQDPKQVYSRTFAGSPSQPGSRGRGHCRQVSPVRPQRPWQPPAGDSRLVCVRHPGSRVGALPAPHSGTLSLGGLGTALLPWLHSRPRESGGGSEGAADPPAAQGRWGSTGHESLRTLRFACSSVSLKRIAGAPARPLASVTKGFFPREQGSEAATFWGWAF